MAFISQIKLSDTTYDISAIKLKNARTISLTGSVTGSGSFDGSSNLSITTTSNDMGAGYNYAYNTSTGQNWGWAHATGTVTVSTGVYYGVNAAILTRNNDEASGWQYLYYNKIDLQKLENGKDYFWIFDVYSSLDCTITLSNIMNGNGTEPIATSVQQIQNTVPANKWTTCVYKLTMNIGTTPVQGQLMYMSVSRRDTGMQLKFKNPRLVNSNINSGYSNFESYHTYLNSSNYTDYTVTKTGTGATGTWGINISGNAATATKLATARTISLTGSVTGSGSFDGSGNLSIATTTNHSHSYLPLAGGTMTGSITLGSGTVQLKKAGTSASWINGRDQAAVRITSYNAYNAGLSMKTTNGSWEIGVYTNDNMWFTYAPDTNYNAGTNTVAQFRAASNGTIYGAVWNDYAEFRNQKEEIKPGYCVASADNGQLYKTTEKFQACDGIVSDTFGFAIGETDECKTPLAVAGRVLAYCEGNRNSYHSGDTVCAGSEGKVCKMTREEIRKWPDRIVGIVSEIPEYDTWGTGNIKVNGRIWIKVK